MGSKDESSQKKRKCPNEIINWTRDLTLKLIGQYESHPNLRDVSSDNYKNRNMRKSSLDEISNALAVPVQEINPKIHYLRCQFQSINRKRYKTKSGQAAEDNFIVRWKFYDALKFLNVPKGFNSETTIDSLSQENEPEMQGDTPELLSESQESDQGRQNNVGCEDFLSSPLIFINAYVEKSLISSPSTLSPCAATPLASSSGGNTPFSSPLRVETPPPSTQRVAAPTIATEKKGRGKNKRELEQQALVNRCLGVMSGPQDSFEIFGDYVADELRSMSSKASDLQSRAKREIQRIILEMNELYDSRISGNNLQQFAPVVEKNLSSEEGSARIFYEESQNLLKL